MSKWPHVKLRRVAKLGTGHTPSRQRPEYWVDCTIPWLTLADVWQLRDGTTQTIYETSEKISMLGLANSAAVLHPAGTVALSRTASVGFSCILGADMATSQDYATWTCSPALLPRYLLYALRGLRDAILGMRMGSTHQTIYMPDIERIAVPAPPVPAQEAIVKFLDNELVRIDALISKKRQMVVLLDEQLSALLREMLVAVQRVPLRRVAELLPGYTFSSSEFTPEGNGPRLLRGINVGVGHIRWTGEARLNEPPGPRLDRYLLATGDIVLGMDRPFVGNGTRVAIVTDSDAGAYLVQRVCRIRPVNARLSSVVRWSLASSEFTRHVEPDLTGVSVPHLSEEQIGTFAVPHPDEAKLEEIIRGSLVHESRHRGLTSALGKQIALLQEHRQALITAAVTGEMEVPGVAS